MTDLLSKIQNERTRRLARLDKEGAKRTGTTHFVRVVCPPPPPPPVTPEEAWEKLQSGERAELRQTFPSGFVVLRFEIDHKRRRLRIERTLRGGDTRRVARSRYVTAPNPAPIVTVRSIQLPKNLAAFRVAVGNAW